MGIRVETERYIANWHPELADLEIAEDILRRRCEELMLASERATLASYSYFTGTRTELKEILRTARALVDAALGSVHTPSPEIEYLRSKTPEHGKLSVVPKKNGVSHYLASGADGIGIISLINERQKNIIPVAGHEYTHHVQNRWLSDALAIQRHIGFRMEEACDNMLAQLRNDRVVDDIASLSAESARLQNYKPSCETKYLGFISEGHARTVQLYVAQELERDGRDPGATDGVLGQIFYDVRDTYRALATAFGEETDMMFLPEPYRPKKRIDIKELDQYEYSTYLFEKWRASMGDRIYRKPYRALLGYDGKDAMDRTLVELRLTDVKEKDESG